MEMESRHEIHCIRQYPLYRARAMQRVVRGADSHSPLSNGIPTRSDMASYQAAHECKTTASHTRNKGWIRIAIEDAELVRALIGCASSHSARMQPRFRDPRRRDPGGKFGHLRKTSRARTGESDASEHERIDADQPAAASLTS